MNYAVAQETLTELDYQLIDEEVETNDDYDFREAWSLLQVASADYHTAVVRMMHANNRLHGAQNVPELCIDPLVERTAAIQHLGQISVQLWAATDIYRAAVLRRIASTAH